MVHPAKTDIVPLLYHLVSGLKPYAESKGREILFRTEVLTEHIWYNPVDLSYSIIHFICQMVNLIPYGGKINILLNKQNHCTELHICNSGKDLSQSEEFIHNGTLRFFGTSMADGSDFCYTFSSELHKPACTSQDLHKAAKAKALPEFYDEVRKRLRSYFTKAENLTNFLQAHHPKDAVFLDKVHKLIDQNMENELFDSTALAKALHLSRTQLYRRIKPIIQQAPATYIKSLRLQKAKTLLENSDLTIGQVCFSTGFQSQSHFAKVFTEQFGVCPSLFRRSKMEQIKQSLQHIC